MNIYNLYRGEFHMKIYWKALCFTLILIVNVVFLISCDSKWIGSTELILDDLEKKSEDIPYELNLLSGTDPSRPINPEKDILTQEMEKILNVKVSIEYIDVQQYAQKLSLRIASGNIPDIVAFTGVSGVTLDDYKKYAGQNILADITSLLNEVDTPNLWKALPGELIEKAKVKGKVYGIPYNTGPGAGYRWNVLYRKDILEQINAKPAQTLNEYRILLKRIKNEKSGVIPLGAFGSLGEQRFAGNTFDHIIGAFGVQPGYFYLENDEIKAYDVHPRMKEAIDYLKKIYNEGLIDKEWATMKEPNLREKFISGKVFSTLSWWTNANLYDKDIEVYELRKLGKIDEAESLSAQSLEMEKFKYVTLAHVLTGSDDKNIAGFGSEFFAIRGVSTRTKDVKRVLSIFDKACIPEINLYANWGMEGRDYEIKNGKLDSSLQGQTDSKINLWSDGYSRDFGGLSLAPNILGVPRYMEALPLRRAEGLSCALNTPGQISDAAVFLESETKITRIKEIYTMRDIYWTQIILGSDISKFDEFVEKWKAEGGEQILKELNASYRKQKDDGILN